MEIIDQKSIKFKLSLLYNIILLLKTENSNK